MQGRRELLRDVTEEEVECVLRDLRLRIAFAALVPLKTEGSHARPEGQEDLVGDALVMFTSPEEALGPRRWDPSAPATAPYQWLTGRKKRPSKQKLKSAEEERRHDVLPVPPLHECVWNPPTEPWRTHGLDWHEDPRIRREHIRAVRASLQAFLNRHLARLNGMVRSGWFVLGKVRVRVVECRPVPERVFRERARGVARLGLAIKPADNGEDISLDALDALGVPRSTVRGWLRQGLLKKTRAVGVLRATAEARRRMARYGASPPGQ